MRRILGAFFVGLVVLATGALVVTALRPTEPPQSNSMPIEMGAVAAVGDRAWRWSGPSDCAVEADVRQVEWREGSGDWTGVRMPLSNVASLQFGDEMHGVAVGTTPRECERGIALTVDGGRSWHYRLANPVLLDAWWADDWLWGISRDDAGDPSLEAFMMRDNFRLVPVRGIGPTIPCEEDEDGPLTQVAFFDDEVGLVLCEQPLTGGRLLARTSTASEFFDRLADGRAETGLNGSGGVLDLDVVGRRQVWVLFEPGDGCEEGQLRRSESQGASFERLPCASDTARVDEVFDVSFSSPAAGLLIGQRAGALVLLETEDGGSTWSP